MKFDIDNLEPYEDTLFNIRAENKHLEKKITEISIGILIGSLSLRTSIHITLLMDYLF